MPLNSVAREKLGQLKRGQALPYRPRPRVRCPECGFGVPRSRYRKTCPRPGCDGRMPAKPPILCRLCERSIPKGRYSWCGDECVEAYYLTVSSSYLRARTYERDKGICAECGLDTVVLYRRVNKMELPQRKEACLVLAENGFNTGSYNWPGVGSLWDADHIESLDEGGSWEMLNVQTLCHFCHKKKTAEQAGRKGKQRRLIGKKYIQTQEMLRLVGVR